jgi:hypothetical protein
MAAPAASITMPANAAHSGYCPKSRSIDAPTRKSFVSSHPQYRWITSSPAGSEPGSCAVMWKDTSSAGFRRNCTPMSRVSEEYPYGVAAAARVSTGPSLPTAGSAGHAVAQLQLAGSLQATQQHSRDGCERNLSIVIGWSSREAARTGSRSKKPTSSSQRPTTLIAVTSSVFSDLGPSLIEPIDYLWSKQHHYARSRRRFGLRIDPISLMRRIVARQNFILCRSHRPRPSPTTRPTES